MGERLSYLLVWTEYLGWVTDIPARKRESEQLELLIMSRPLHRGKFKDRSGERFALFGLCQSFKAKGPRPRCTVTTALSIKLNRIRPVFNVSVERTLRVN